MVHLKTYEEVNWFKFYKPKKQDISIEEFRDRVDDIDDILLELKDDGKFKIEGPIDSPGAYLSWQISKKVKFSWSDIANRKAREDEFRISDISEVILRLMDYASSKEMLTNIRIFSFLPNQNRLADERFNPEVYPEWRGVSPKVFNKTVSENPYIISIMIYFKFL